MCSACSGDEYREVIAENVRASRRAAEPLKVVCAWHAKNFGVELVMRAGTEPVSHGICEDCRFIAEKGIVVSANCVCPPIPVRGFDWLAIDSATYDASYQGEDETGPCWRSSPVGRGETQEEAVKDLVAQLREERAS